MIPATDMQRVQEKCVRMYLMLTMGKSEGFVYVYGSIFFNFLYTGTLSK